MGNFAAIYNLPAGEQLLVVLCDTDGDGPAVQYITEVNGTMVSATVPMLEQKDQGDYLKRMAAREEARMMIGAMDDDAVKAIRRRFARDMNDGIESDFPKEEIKWLQN